MAQKSTATAHPSARTLSSRGPSKRRVGYAEKRANDGGMRIWLDSFCPPFYKLLHQSVVGYRICVVGNHGPLLYLEETEVWGDVPILSLD